MIFARKMPEFYLKLSEKNPFLVGGTRPSCPLPLPVSYAYDNKRKEKNGTEG